jgi:hypothetical protein
MIGKMKTPQTDDLARGNHVVPTEWAEQLERERDEAREKYDNEATEHMLAINRICNERDEARDKMERWERIALRSDTERAEAIRERDEAREISKAASKGISKTARLNQFLLSELIAVRKERDELKEIASEFAMTASHCLGWHENKNPNQITSALSRWLKISTNELDA